MTVRTPDTAASDAVNAMLPYRNDGQLCTAVVIRSTALWAPLLLENVLLLIVIAVLPCPYEELDAFGRRPPEGLTSGAQRAGVTAAEVSGAATILVYPAGGVNPAAGAPLPTVVLLLAGAVWLPDPAAVE